MTTVSTINCGKRGINNFYLNHKKKLRWVGKHNFVEDLLLYVGIEKKKHFTAKLLQI